jgi:hypothetical protein
VLWHVFGGLYKFGCIIKHEVIFFWTNVICSIFGYFVSGLILSQNLGLTTSDKKQLLCWIENWNLHT